MPFKVRSFTFEVSGLAVVLRLGVRGVSLPLVFHCLGKCGSSVWPPDFPIPYNWRVGRTAVNCILCK